MKRYYFLKYKDRVFALDPRSRTMTQTAPIDAGAPRTPMTLAQTTPEELGIPAGRRWVQRAAIWQYTPLRLLMEHELNKGRNKNAPHQNIFPFTTPLPKPLVAFLAQDIWTDQQQEQWEKEQRIKNTRKKQIQRANRKATKKQKQVEGWVNINLDEETE
jgi:hypothetical protein